MLRHAPRGRKFAHRAAMRSIVIVLLAFGLAGCRRGQEEKTTSGTHGAAKTGAKQAARAPVYSEPEALGVLAALDDAEIAIAKVAREVSQNDDVLRFASVLASDHRGLKEIIDAEAVKAGITPAGNAAAAQIRAEGDSIARALSGVTVGFNNTWVEEQVKAHQKTIAVLDTAIMPSVANAQAHKLLEQARPTLLAHLQRAMQILALRRKQAAERGEAWVSGIQAAPGALGASAQGAQPAEAPHPQPHDTTAQPAPVKPPPPDTTPPTSTSNM